MEILPSCEIRNKVAAMFYVEFPATVPVSSRGQKESEKLNWTEPTEASRLLGAKGRREVSGRGRRSKRGGSQEVLPKSTTLEQALLPHHSYKLSLPRPPISKV